MRKLFTMFMSITLLFVSSVPMLSEAASCELPAHEIAMQEATMHEFGVHENLSGMPTGHASNAEQHVRLAALTGDLPLNRIECGCGCHRSIDALPHLLAPHLFSLALSLNDVASVPVAPQSFAMPVTIAVAIPVPPPRKLIIS